MTALDDLQRAILRHSTGGSPVIELTYGEEDFRKIEEELRGQARISPNRYPIASTRKDGREAVIYMGVEVVLDNKKGIKDDNTKTRDRDTTTNANVEQTLSNGAMAKEDNPRFNSPVRITFLHVRKRLADIDGLSGKAAIDGIVAVNILADDSPKQVQSVLHTQAKGTTEKTIITIEVIS